MLSRRRGCVWWVKGNWGRMTGVVFDWEKGYAFLLKTYRVFGVGCGLGQSYVWAWDR